jgi:uncharacterized protein HemX
MTNKQFIEFAKTNPKTTVAIFLLAVVIVAALIAGVHAIGTQISNSRISALEAEKQQFLKERDKAHERDLILQGQIQAKDEVIKSLTSQIAESNQRVVNAHNETQTAKQSVQKVRSDPPKFNSADDAGRILELGSELHGLYPDSP